MHTHDELPQDVRETIDLWVSDFFDRPASIEPGGRVGERAQDVLVELLTTASDERGPASLSEAAVGHALVDHPPGGSLPATNRAAIPELVAAFLADLEDVGRLGGGRGLAAYVRAMAPQMRRQASGETEALRRPAAKVGRNDPCPCGSGRKYKQCCLNALG